MCSDHTSITSINCSLSLLPGSIRTTVPSVNFKFLVHLLAGHSSSLAVIINCSSLGCLSETGVSGYNPCTSAKCAMHHHNLARRYALSHQLIKITDSVNSTHDKYTTERRKQFDVTCISTASPTGRQVNHWNTLKTWKTSNLEDGIHHRPTHPTECAVYYASLKLI